MTLSTDLTAFRLEITPGIATVPNASCRAHRIRNHGNNVAPRRINRQRHGSRRFQGINPQEQLQLSMFAAPTAALLHQMHDVNISGSSSAKLNQQNSISAAPDVCTPYQASNVSVPVAQNNNSIQQARGAMQNAAVLPAPFGASRTPQCSLHCSSNPSPAMTNSAAVTCLPSQRCQNPVSVPEISQLNSCLNATTPQICQHLSGPSEVDPNKRVILLAQQVQALQEQVAQLQTGSHTMGGSRQQSTMIHQCTTAQRNVPQPMSQQHMTQVASPETHTSTGKKTVQGMQMDRNPPGSVVNSSQGVQQTNIIPPQNADVNMPSLSGQNLCIAQQQLHRFCDLQDKRSQDMAATSVRNAARMNSQVQGISGYSPQCAPMQDDAGTAQQVSALAPGQQIPTSTGSQQMLACSQNQMLHAISPDQQHPMEAVAVPAVPFQQNQTKNGAPQQAIPFNSNHRALQMESGNATLATNSTPRKCRSQGSKANAKKNYRELNTVRSASEVTQSNEMNFLWERDVQINREPFDVFSRGLQPISGRTKHYRDDSVAELEDFINGTLESVDQCDTASVLTMRSLEDVQTSIVESFEPVPTAIRISSTGVADSSLNIQNMGNSNRRDSSITISDLNDEVIASFENKSGDDFSDSDDDRPLAVIARNRIGVHTVGQHSEQKSDKNNARLFCHADSEVPLHEESPQSSQDCSTTGPHVDQPAPKPVDPRLYSIYYNWKAMTLAERRQRRSNILRLRRIPARKGWSSIRKGESVIRFRSFTKEEIDSFEPPPADGIKAQKKMRNRALANENRNKNKERMEFLEKENKKLLAQRSTFEQVAKKLVVLYRYNQSKRACQTDLRRNNFDCMASIVKEFDIFLGEIEEERYARQRDVGQRAAQDGAKERKLT